MPEAKYHVEVFDRSQSPEWEVRRDAAKALGQLLPAVKALGRLSELLDDDDVAVEQEAAEALIRYGGRDGLLAVLEALGRRAEDPDADYLAHRLRELEIFDGIPVRQRAREIGQKYTAGLVADGIRQLEELMDTTDH
ncbi:HEAT repeat domain-containing protein [Nocardia brasiliensis]|uniref:HEAT repeat domain-containing protein n=1 Tax=Nocardia brasiliensis TaxID=37326 RepID=UPI003672882B